ncbi:carboxypeptidase PM20D1 [Microbulbifer donghaiensis]|uniref:Carboxypeptidase PM20D1 n=1 Tax=Microbulbifer donghaiensis TaxID=494016 RepID=A0A1M4YJ60_9GAMM|nr:M20 family peptidase [Microbulbifer donghaiensis]SHF05678.1 carboxypeptidase PM20D1 [Microbulbifer donghaiensis]
MKKLLLGIATTFLLLAALLLVRTATYTAPPLAEVAIQKRTIDGRPIAQHLSEAIQFRTVSSQLPEPQTQSQFEAFIGWLAKTYPEVHSAMAPARLGIDPEHRYTLLFTWPGKRADLAPILLSAHYDVVPVIPGTERDWQHPPYEGAIDDTHIWGRGALDDKSAAIALMEATTLLLAQGFQPERTVYLSLTSDEETGGDSGTAAVVEKLKQDGVQLAWSLDEGSFLLRGFIPGVDATVASINVAEKGYMTVDLVARGQGGHSSMPPQETAVDILAKALTNLRQSPLPSGLEGLSGDMFDSIAPYMPFGKKMLFANRWLFGSLIDSALSTQPGTAAMLHTTIAPTMLSGSVKDNVLPIEAVATINLRVHPRDSIEGIVKHLNAAIDDERVEVKVRRADTASRVSSTESVGFNNIAEAAQQTYGPLVIAPGLTVAGTDSRRYETVADDSYRFNPMVVTKEDTHGFHGTNERISIENMVHATNFYSLLIEKSSRE